MNPTAAARFDEARMALAVLTRLPVGRFPRTVPTMGASAWAWPLAGALVGAPAAAAWSLALAAGVPALPAAAMALAILALATGALHEDGLADLADGLGGGRDRDHRLEIMRDSRIGSHGALALGLCLLLRAGALASLGQCTGAWALVGLAAASRAALPPALFLMPPARGDGLGRAAGGVDGARVVVAVALGVGLLAACVPGAALPALVAMTLAGTALAAFAARRLGGQTGDVLGALQQTCEAAGWVALAAVMAGG